MTSGQIKNDKVTKHIILYNRGLTRRTNTFAIHSHKAISDQNKFSPNNWEVEITLTINRNDYTYHLMYH